MFSFCNGKDVIFSYAVVVVSWGGSTNSQPAAAAEMTTIMKTYSMKFKAAFFTNCTLQMTV